MSSIVSMIECCASRSDFTGGKGVSGTIQRQRCTRTSVRMQLPEAEFGTFQFSDGLRLVFRCHPRPVSTQVDTTKLLLRCHRCRKRASQNVDTAQSRSRWEMGQHIVQPVDQCSRI